MTFQSDCEIVCEEDAVIVEGQEEIQQAEVQVSIQDQQITESDKKKKKIKLEEEDELEKLVEELESLL